MHTENNWISVKDSIPPFFPDCNFSENVWGWDDTNETLLVVARVSYDCDDDNDEWVWGNCYGDVFGSPGIDCNYNITYWMPIHIPKKPDADIDNIGVG